MPILIGLTSRLTCPCNWPSVTETERDVGKTLPALAQELNSKGVLQATIISRDPFVSRNETCIIIMEDIYYLAVIDRPSGQTINC